MPRVAILMYHSISRPRTKSERDRRYCCSPERFEAHLAYLRSSRFDVVGLEVVEEYLETGKGLGHDAVALTFDDGFRDNYENAFPLLKMFGFPATIFVAVGFIGSVGSSTTNRRFMDQEMLEWEQLLEMQSDGVTIGSHTLNHPRLPELSLSEARKEISESKHQLEVRLHKTIDYFAYPYGLYDSTTQQLVKDAAFTLACSTRSGFNKPTTEPYGLRRIEVYGTDSVWKLSQKLKFGINDAGILFPMIYYAARLRDRISPASWP